MEKQPNQLKWGERISFIGGEFFGGGAVPIMSSIYMLFLIKWVDLAPIAAGAIILASKLWDAITDPIMGVISDNTRCRLGRRRPWLFLGAGLIIPGMLMLFAPGYIGDSMSEGARIATCLFTYLAYSTISTIYNVPYVSFTSEFSTNVEERSTVNAIRIVLAMISGGICLMIPSKVFELCRDGAISFNTFYLVIAFIFGLYFAIPMLIVAIFTKERVPYNKDEKVKFSWKKFFQPLKVKAFTMLIVMYTFSFACMDLISAQLILFLGSALPGLESMFIYLVLMVTGGVCMPILKLVMNKGVSKNTIFRTGIPFYMIGVIGLAWVQPEVGWLAYVFAAIAGIGFGCVQMIPWLIFPDLCDVGELKLKEPNAGSFSAIMTFMRKVASGLGVFCISAGLQSIPNYDPFPDDPNYIQPVEAVNAIRLIMTLSAAIFLVLALLGSLGMKLTKTLHKQVKELLEIQRRDGNLDAMTEEQAANYAVIQKKLF